MKTNWFRQVLILFLCNALIYSPLLHAAQLSLPSGDLIAPEVSHEVITDSLEAGSSVRLKATVTDNVGIKSVTLFYRNKGVEDYNRVSMNRVGETSDYTVTLGKDELVTPGVEYYIQAMDLAGNSLLHGYSFSPLTLNVVPATTVATEETAISDPTEQIIQQEPKQEEKKSSTNKWIWIGLGILAAGAAVAVLASGDDSSDGGGGGGDTGTVVVTAPTP